MHELALTQEILFLAEKASRGEKVKRIVVEVGDLSCVSQNAIRFAFELCREGTAADGATLEIVASPGEELTLKEIEVA